MSESKMAHLVIPEYKHTAIDSIPATVSQLRATFNSQKTKPIAFRLVQLRKLYWGYAVFFLFFLLDSRELREE